MSKCVFFSTNVSLKSYDMNDDNVTLNIRVLMYVIYMEHNYTLFTFTLVTVFVLNYFI